MFSKMTKPSRTHEVDARRVAFGQRLRSIRERNGATQSAIAAEAGLHRVFYSRVEGGLENVSLDNLFKIADALGVDVRELFAAST